MNGTERKLVYSWTTFHQDERPSTLLMFGKELSMSQKLGFFFSLTRLRRMRSRMARSSVFVVVCH